MYSTILAAKIKSMLLNKLISSVVMLTKFEA